ncbi:hypothetical protein KUTeg_017984 [Tegillarca granosa]|uniref:Uncharacterized protein n=1 Tax=Tegillarca granosa TaxID=220873 RepID=A0ABQ9EGK9_TEGGR|nr:hypothetical protein KUTeg_017984 [Tegillarca granosa]
MAGEENDQNTKILALEVTDEQKKLYFEFLHIIIGNTKKLKLLKNQLKFQRNYLVKLVKLKGGNLLFHKTKRLMNALIASVDHWENGQRGAHANNSSLRKELCKRFWTNHKNVWKDPRYLGRKQQAMARDLGIRNFVNHRRDLIPKCVIILVRNWLPNPSDKPYFGHMWE